jgi:hypothetical protein
MQCPRREPFIFQVVDVLPASSDAVLPGGRSSTPARSRASSVWIPCVGRSRDSMTQQVEASGSKHRPGLLQRQYRGGDLRSTRQRQCKSSAVGVSVLSGGQGGRWAVPTI